MSRSKLPAFLAMVFIAVSVMAPVTTDCSATKMLLSGVGMGLTGLMRLAESPQAITAPIADRTLQNQQISEVGQHGI